VTVQFGHERLDAYQAALKLVAWVEVLLSDMDLTVAARDHLRRVSESIVRNIVRANSKRTPADRAKIFDVSYGSALECAACLDVPCAWQVTETQDGVRNILASLRQSCFTQPWTVNRCPVPTEWWRSARGS